MRVIGLLLCCLLPLSAQSGPRTESTITTEVDVMYKKGLDFLISTQASDGKWQDHMTNNPAVGGFALLALLAKGDNLHTPRVANFIQKLLNNILSYQDQQTGYFGNNMYNHGFVTLVLAEAYGTLSDPRLGLSLQKAVDLILDAQKNNPNKAWRYTPKSTDADSTVTGCQIVSLIAARNAGIAVPDQVIEQGLAYIESCRCDDASYGYTDNTHGRPTLTAIAVLCHAIAQREETPEIRESVKYLTKRLNYRDQHYPFYYEYYMSQALFHANPKGWEEWNKRNIKYLKLIQAPNGSWDGNHGEVYCTSAALLSLALNYRLLPIYEKF